MSPNFMLWKKMYIEREFLHDENKGNQYWA